MMTPTKAKDLVPEVAETLGIPDEDLGAMVSFYYKENKKRMSKLEQVLFHLKGLGSMKLMGWRIDKYMAEKQTQLDKQLKSNVDHPYKYTINELRKAVAIFEQALVKWNEQRSLYREVRARNRQFYADKNKNNDLEGKTSSGLDE